MSAWAAFRKFASACLVAARSRFLANLAPSIHSRGTDMAIDSRINKIRKQKATKKLAKFALAKAIAAETEAPAAATPKAAKAK